MKANELRIGNLVTDEFYDSFKSIIKVENVNNEGINLFIEDDGNWSEVAYRWISPEYHLEQLRPIPITEEWVLRFGFARKSDRIYAKIINETFDIGYDFGIEHTCVLSFRSTYSTAFRRVKINYVHQLQNLYFALTGEELTIKDL